MPTQNTAVSHEITLGEEEISDDSLATFYVFDKENASSGVQLVGHRGCGGCHGCRGCRGCHRGCRGCGRLLRLRRLLLVVLPLADGATEAADFFAW
jgi:hypothetical protein